MVLDLLFSESVVMLYSKLGNYIQAYFMELNEYKQKLLLILIISKFKISCPCLLTLISRICIILTHPWGAPECPKGVFHAFLADATGTASS